MESLNCIFGAAQYFYLELFGLTQVFRRLNMPRPFSQFVLELICVGIVASERKQTEVRVRCNKVNSVIDASPFVPDEIAVHKFYLIRQRLYESSKAIDV